MLSSTNERAFETPQALSDWLRQRLPSLSLDSWGITLGTKNLHNLWLELRNGESTLEDSNPPIRRVGVVIARIRGGSENQILVESQQQLSNGATRDRFRLLSEKMKPDETPESALFRAIREELGSVVRDGKAVTMVADSCGVKVEERDSESYPGLLTRYVLHSAEVVVDRLPCGEFWTEETREASDMEKETAMADGAVFVERHLWRWVDHDSIRL